MSIVQWLVFILFVQVLHGICTWKLYIAAGRKAWEAFVPVYNGIVLMQIINRPKWWVFLLFIPIINLLLFAAICVETLRTFGKKSTLDMILGVATLGLYVGYVNYTQQVTYHKDRDLTPATKGLDFVGSITFAIVVATLVHSYLIQPFTIPTSSLEKSLLIGDFLFVSKYNYGARTPMTPVAAPMVHDTIPLVNVKSYTTFPQLPYFRFPGYEKIKNNDIVVFNWPTDTLYNMYKVADKRYDKPIDKKTNYVKRCVGIAGDSLEIKDGNVYINGKELILPERAKPQFFYKIKVKQNSIQNIKTEYQITEAGSIFEINNKIWDNPSIKEELIKNYSFEEIDRDSINSYVNGGIDENLFKKLSLSFSNIYFYANLTNDKYEKIKTDSRIASVERRVSKVAEDGVFPDFKDGINSTLNNWNVDNFGPIYIPKKGATVAINKNSLPFYKKIISEYENNDLQVNGSDILINGKKSTSYTFKQDYFWMMGDNRHNSLDARYFGYTPENHIVGKPIFIWMSWDSNGEGVINKIRWDRLFTTVSGEGQPQSYFKFFLIFLAGYFAFDYFRNKKKKKEVN